MLRTRASLLASSGVIRAAAASGVMLEAASSLACLRLEKYSACCQPGLLLWHAARCHFASDDSLRFTGDILRNLGRTHVSIPQVGGPAEQTAALELGADRPQGRRLNGGAACSKTDGANTLAHGGSAAGVESSNSPNHPHLHSHAAKGEGTKRSDWWGGRTGAVDLENYLKFPKEKHGAGCGMRMRMRQQLTAGGVGTNSTKARAWPTKFLSGSFHFCWGHRAGTMALNLGGVRPLTGYSIHSSPRTVKVHTRSSTEACHDEPTSTTSLA